MARRYFARTVTAPTEWKEIPLPGPSNEILVWANDADVTIQIRTPGESWGDEFSPYAVSPVWLPLTVESVRVKSTSGSSTFTLVALYK